MKSFEYNRIDMEQIDSQTLESITTKCFKAHLKNLEPATTSIESKLVRIDRVRAVLFDIYGTLFISASGDIGTTNDALKTELFEQTLTAAGIVNRSKGGSVDKTITSAKRDTEGAPQIAERAFYEGIRVEHERLIKSGTLYPEVRIEEIWDKVTDTLRESRTVKPETVFEDRLLKYKLSVEYEVRVNPVSPMPGMTEAIERLSSKGFPIGIVSNAQFFTPFLFDAYVGKSLAALGFNPELCAFSYQLREAKPSPRIFAPVLDFLSESYGIVPEETVYVGNDMLNDVSTSKRAGCRAILFAGDKRSLRLREEREDCKGVEPDAIITEWSQLAHVVNS